MEAFSRLLRRIATTSPGRTEYEGISTLRPLTVKCPCRTSCRACGLAAVPGAARARRFRNLRHSPRYYACYDLVAPDVLERREWLAVRGTEWSSRVRPTFRNPKRTMFEKA